MANELEESVILFQEIINTAKVEKPNHRTFQLKDCLAIDTFGDVPLRLLSSAGSKAALSELPP